MSTEYSKNVKSPRVVVLIDGIRVKINHVSVTNSNFFIADTYNIALDALNQPKGIDLNFFTQDKEFECQIYAGYPDDPNNYTQNDLTLIMAGDSNEVEIDFGSGLVDISGKDLSSRLIGTQVTQNFANNTGSQLAKQFAQSNGLKSEVTENSQILGVLYKDQQTLKGNTTQWDLLCSAAQQINFVTYVKGETLYFKPAPDEKSANPYVLKYVAPTFDNPVPLFDAPDLRIHKNSGLAKAITVTVKVPYSTKTGEDFSVKVRSKLRTSKGTGGKTDPGANKYEFSYPGLTPQQAHAKALQILKSITIHGIRMECRLEMDEKLQKDSVIKLTGTGTNADQIYYPDHIGLEISESSAYMSISAKNKPSNLDLDTDAS